METRHQSPAKRISDIDIRAGYAYSKSNISLKTSQVTKQFFRNLSLGAEGGRGTNVFFEIEAFISLTTARCITSRSSPENPPRVYHVSKR